MKGKVNFLVKFLILSTVLFLIWIPLGKVYLLLLAWVSKCVLLIMGYNAGLVVDGSPVLFVYYGHVAVMENAHLMNFNIIPLVALILATPRIELVRRITMLAIGIFLLFCMHVIDLVSHFTDYEVLVIFMAVGEVAVPFVLWFVLAHKEILGNMQKR
ncbi:MAG TPA: hypothetical protein EYP67_06485 [Methanosarcinales archaeon]|nr:hypothetical protein [Methanosarcinales archaeon]